MNKLEAARAEALQRENTRLYEEHKAMRAAMKEFVYRVEAGEVKSTYTYNQFKEVLKNLK